MSSLSPCRYTWDIWGIFEEIWGKFELNWGKLEYIEGNRGNLKKIRVNWDKLRETVACDVNSLKPAGWLVIKLIAQTLTHVLQGPFAIKKLGILHQQEMVLEVQEAKILLSFE